MATVVRPNDIYYVAPRAMPAGNDPKLKYQWRLSSAALARAKGSKIVKIFPQVKY